MLPASVMAQVIRGTIKDTKGQVVPYSTVYVRELSLGAAANQDGYFSVRVPEGKYVCVFQSLGYQPVVKEITVTRKSEPLEIVLQDMVYDLSGVVIQGKREDPAYDVMRRVIAKAPYYAGQVRAYKAEVYIKGSLHINSISKVVKWLAKDDLKEMNIKEGDIYLQESVNEVDFTAPNTFKQKVKSFRNTFPESGNDMSSNALGMISGNIYREGGFGAAFSPLNKGAFNYYRFRHDGKVKYNNYTIHRITIIPKGKGAQYVKGTVFIVDGLWCVSNLDIYKEEQLGVEMYLTQNYNEVKEGVWLPVTNQMKVNADLMGNSGTFNYSTSIRYNDLKVRGTTQESLPLAKAVKPDDKKAIAFREKITRKIDKKQQEIEKLQSLEDIKTEESYRIAELKRQQNELRAKDSLRFRHEYKETYTVEADTAAGKHDTTYWNTIRPIPLTQLELEGTRKFDSTKRVIQQDTTRSKVGPFILKLVFGGAFISDTIYNIRTKGLVNPFSLSFDVVDGLKYRTSFTYNKTLRGGREYALQPAAGYAFGSKRFYWEVLGFRRYKVFNTETGIRMGQQSFDFNPDGIHPLESTLEALVFRENPARLYHSSYFDFHYKREIVHSLSGRILLHVADNQVLENVSDYSFFFRDEKDFKPNIPENIDYRMANHQDLSAELSLIYRPMPYYYIKDGIKVPYDRFNDFPEYTFSYLKGIPLKPFDTDYDVLRLNIRQQKRLGTYNRLNYMFETGWFMNTRQIWFNEYQHFAKRPLIAGVKEFFPYFLLIDSYRFSTREYYLVGHMQYKSPLIILKRLPVLRNRLWTESFFLSYLYTPDYKNYIESGYGIGGLIFNLGVFAGFEGFKYQQVGLRLAFTIFGTKEIAL